MNSFDMFWWVLGLGCGFPAPSPAHPEGESNETVPCVWPGGLPEHDGARAQGVGLVAGIGAGRDGHVGLSLCATRLAAPGP